MSQIMSDLAKQRWSDPVYREKVLAARKKAMSSPEYKEKQASITKARWQNPEFKEKTLKSITSSCTTPEFREKMIAINKERCSTSEFREQKSEALKAQIKEQGHPSKNKIWIHSPEEQRNRRIDCNAPIPAGWLRGRKMVFE